MIFVAVSEEDRVQRAPAQTRVVRDHSLDTVVPFGEHLTGVNQQAVLARLKEERVHAELAQAPNRGDSEIGAQGP